MEFRTIDHPQANGRKAIPGEQQWTLLFPLENGEKLKVKIGKLGRDTLKKMFEQEEIDDTIDSNPKDN